MAFVAFSTLHPALGAPGDIFTTAAPILGSDPPKADALQEGDESVSTQTGALQYSYPIKVPPGRQGMQPHLALSYSSQAPIYGTIAAGWSLSIPSIREDTSKGRLRTQTPGVVNTFVSSLSGGRRLVKTTTDAVASGVIETYRAQGDSTYARYQRMASGQSFRWRVLTPDGTTYLFADSNNMGGCVNIGDGNAPLTETIDSFGNRIDYLWGPGSGSPTQANDCQITTITYGSNIAAGLPPLANIYFNYIAPGLCAQPASGYGIPVGSATDYHQGFQHVSGSMKLDSITIRAMTSNGNPRAGAVHERDITLAYDPATESCTNSYAAYRQLLSIQETASGTDSPQVVLPPVEFTYGSAALTYPSETASTVPWNTTAANNRSFNLAWGYRLNDPTKTWPTVEAMLLDVDGDGLLDRVTNNPVTTIDLHGNTQIVSCRATWERNLGPDSTGKLKTFQAPLPIPLPMLKWAEPSTLPPVYHGGAYSNDDTHPSSLGFLEGCALNYQRTGYVNSHDPGHGFCGADATCPASGICTTATHPTNNDCAGPVVNGGGPQTYFAYRWMDMDGDGLVDIVAAPAGPASLRYYNLQDGNGRAGYVGEVIEHTFDAAFSGSQCPQASFSALPDNWGQYTMCHGMYPWFIYKNQGHGVFATTPTLRYQPVPLDTDTGDSTIALNVVGQDKGVFDIDGDGFPDAIMDGPTFNGTDWMVYLGDGTGGFMPANVSLGDSFMFGTQYNEKLSVTGWPVATSSPVSTIGFVDINGDGLVDHWSSASGSGANVEINDGTRLRLINGVGEVTSSSKPGMDSVAWATSYAGQFIQTGFRSLTTRTLDMDGDGRTDVIEPFPPFYSVALNQGGLFQSHSSFINGSPPSTLVANPFLQYIVGSGAISYPYASITPGSSYSWELRADLVDLDGDGIPDAYDFGALGTTGANQGHLSAAHIPTPTTPPRLLTTIKNNRGATTTVTYASMHDATALPPDPNFQKVSPRAQWVVKNLTVADALANTTSTTGYTYFNPVFSSDDQGKHAFRGFEEVRTMGPSGAVTVQRYDFTVDWSGRLKTTLVIPAEAPAEVRTIDETTPIKLQLLGGTDSHGVLILVDSYQPTTVDHWTCKNGQNEVACRANTDTFTRTTLTYSPVADPSRSADLFEQTGSRLQASNNFLVANGDRTTTTSYVLISNGTTYLSREGTANASSVTPSTTMQIQVAGAPVTYAKSLQLWDPTLRVKLSNEVWVDNVDANRSIDRSVYDMTTGNLLQHWKPVQNGASSHNTTYTYDARSLFPATEVNEAGLEMDYTYEYGTGTKLTTIGPNTSSCAQTTPPSCPTGDPPKQEQMIRIDGLGRTIERWDTFSNDGSDYKFYKVETNVYDDVSYKNTAIATSVTHQHAIDVTGTSFRWTQDKTSGDGHGRPIKKTVSVFGTAPNDQVTTFDYNNDGTLKDVTLPDPSANSAATVTYTYAFDSLGRATAIRRPDATAAIDQSGANISYNGLSTTTTEAVGAATGQPAITTTTKDAFGRLASVGEVLTSGGAVATTTYSYAPDNSVQTIVDPQGVTTTLGRDLAGHRTSITRGSRVWGYGYDKNGNMVSETTPCTGTLCSARYTSTTAYDDLDRPLSKLIAPRDLSASDIALFGDDHETYIWDYGVVGHSANYEGRLIYQRLFAPAVATAVTARVVSYDSQGNAWDTGDSFFGAGFNASRQFVQTHNLLGQPWGTNYGDNLDASATSSATNYDLRGLPSSITLVRTGQGTQTLAVQTRNVAGLVTNRRTTTTGPMTFVESNWSYDKLGRISSQVVQEGPGPVQVARQDLAYFGNDDPKSLDHWLGPTNHKHFNYNYDLRHQLLGVSETQSSAFSATYQYGNAGRFAHATEAAVALPGSEVKPRNVTYQYAGSDPEEVTALVNANSTHFADYAYDLGGNQVSRSYPATGDSWSFVYDGKDQLRRATHSLNGVVQGSEEYWYEAEGTRIAVVKRDASGNVTELIRFLKDVEAHYDGTGNPTFTYSHISLGTPIARVDRTGVSSTLEYQFHGLASSTLAAVDQVGTINASFDYAPFGELVEATDAGSTSGSGVVAHRRRMNDKFIDEVSNLGYYGARYYDSTLMAWTQGDPLFRFAPDFTPTAPRHASLYVYDMNNPLRYLDADGRTPTVLSLPVIVVKVEQRAEACVKEAENWQRVSHLNDAIESEDPISSVLGVSHITGPINDLMEGRSHSHDLGELGTMPAPGHVGMPAFEDGGSHGKAKFAADDANGSGVVQRRGTYHSTELSGVSRGKGGGMKEATDLSGALDQREGIGTLQAKKQRGGKRHDDGTLAKKDSNIVGIDKSDDNVSNRTDRITSSTDSDAQPK